MSSETGQGNAVLPWKLQRITTTHFVGGVDLWKLGRVLPRYPMNCNTSHHSVSKQKSLRDNVTGIVAGIVAASRYTLYLQRVKVPKIPSTMRASHLQREALDG